MKKLILLVVLLFLAGPVYARGVYYNNTVYNTENINKVVKHSDRTVTVYFTNKQQEILKFKNFAEMNRFFDAVSVVIL